MKTAFSVTLFGFVAISTALPVSHGIWPRACKPGTLVCNGKAKFGICNIDTKAVWMNVSDGTECSCSGSDCTIAATSNGAGPSTTSPPPATDTTSFETNPEKESNPAPNTVPNSESPSVSTSAIPSLTVSISSSVPTAVPSTGTNAPEPVGVSNPVASSSSSPSTSSGSDSGSNSGHSYVKTFLGNGDPSQGWPSMSQWVDFDTLWTSSLDVIKNSCKGFQQENNSDEETADLKSAIQEVAKSSGIDDRYLLAITLQESNGCVRAPTTNYGVVNPGLMQSHNGAHTCFNVSPCPASEITGMIRDGAEGTSSGPGLKQGIKNTSNVVDYYKAARIYNSGSIASSGLLQDGIATHCYVSDVANRLIGWAQGPTGCHIS